VSKFEGNFWIMTCTELHSGPGQLSQHSDPSSYGLDFPGIEFRYGKNSPDTSWTAIGPTQ